MSGTVKDIVILLIPNVMMTTLSMFLRGKPLLTGLTLVFAI